ncbi:MAG: TrkA C-terminal domain-containing protein [Dermabacter sp.]|nr:TrkA C-terminal domain-containing protein [Dermabacter sp.]
MVEILAASPLLTLFTAIALGTLVGAIPFGRLKFGPAGALFVGLALGALDPRLGEGLGLVGSIGLTLFVYTIGIAAGASFFRDLRKQAPLMIGAAVLLVAFAGTLILVGPHVGLSGELGGGLFAGALTTTPALASAQAAAGGSTLPAVGYSIAYPIGVVLTMVMITLVTRSRMRGAKDPAPVSSGELLDITVLVNHPMRVSEIPQIATNPGSAAGKVRVSYFMRGGEVSVASPTEKLEEGDRVLLVGEPSAVTDAAAALGTRVSEHLAHDRSRVNFRRFIVSNPALAGRTVADLHVPYRFGGIITRVRRGDRDMLAHADMPLQLGDRVRVVFPTPKRAELAAYFGDSEKRITEVDFFSLGIGIALGVAVGLVALPVGGAQLALGSSAGPLLVGLILGKADRTGPFVWTLPHSANLTIRQLGLVMFLAAVGLSSGQAFASTAFTMTGLTVALLAAVLLALALLAMWGLGHVLGLSSARTAGAIAGFVGQPVLLNHAHSLVDDERTDTGFSALFTAALIVKIIVVQAIVLA